MTMPFDVPKDVDVEDAFDDDEVDTESSDAFDMSEEHDLVRARWDDAEDYEWE